MVDLSSTEFTGSMGQTRLMNGSEATITWEYHGKIAILKSSYTMLFPQILGCSTSTLVEYLVAHPTNPKSVVSQKFSMGVGLIHLQLGRTNLQKRFVGWTTNRRLCLVMAGVRTQDYDHHEWDVATLFQFSFSGVKNLNLNPCWTNMNKSPFLVESTT